MARLTVRIPRVHRRCSPLAGTSIVVIVVVALFVLVNVTVAVPVPECPLWTIAFDNGAGGGTFDQVSTLYAQEGGRPVSFNQIGNLTVANACKGDSSLKTKVSGVPGVTAVWPTQAYSLPNLGLISPAPQPIGSLSINDVSKLGNDGRKRSAGIQAEKVPFNPAFVLNKERVEIASDCSVGLVQLDSGCEIDHDAFKRGPETQGASDGICSQAKALGLPVETRADSRACMLDLSTEQNNRDLNGHGTHVAATVIGNAVGSARGMEMMCIKILDKTGTDSSGQSIFQGMAIVSKLSRQVKSRIALNMSIGLPRDKGNQDALMERIVAQLLDQDVLSIAAAGNDGKDACTESPAFAPGVVTVGATDANNQLAKFSNRGECVDVFANGVNVISANSKNPELVKVLSGTSMATPQITSAAALLMCQGMNVRQTAAEIGRLSTGRVNDKQTPQGILTQRNLASIAESTAEVTTRQVSTGVVVVVMPDSAAQGSGGDRNGGIAAGGEQVREGFECVEWA